MNPFSQIETSKGELVLGRELTTHHGKNSIDIEFGHDCKRMRFDSQALSGQQPVDPRPLVSCYAIRSLKAYRQKESSARGEFEVALEPFHFPSRKFTQNQGPLLYLSLCEPEPFQSTDNCSVDWGCESCWTQMRR